MEKISKADIIDIKIFEGVLGNKIKADFNESNPDSPSFILGREKIAERESVEHITLGYGEFTYNSELVSNVVVESVGNLQVQIKFHLLNKGSNDDAVVVNILKDEIKPKFEFRAGNLMRLDTFEFVGVGVFTREGLILLKNIVNLEEGKAYLLTL